VTGALDLRAGIAGGSVTVDGDPADLQRLVDLLAPADPDFAIVTP
jgi:alkyl sulfatase BDS1-like metallo-beta-lactamase superfamily hydrolase